MTVDWSKLATEWGGAAIKFVATALIVPASVSYYTANRVDQNSKTREAQSAQITKFATGADDMFVNVADFISSVTPSNLTPPHDKLRKSLVQQIQSTDNLLIYFKDPAIDSQIMSYKDILDQSVDALDDANDSVKLVKWANTLSKINDARTKLVKSLLEKAQISS